MRAVALAAPLLHQMRRSADAAYPDECCGFLLTPDDGGGAPVRRISAIAPAVNRSDGERRRRFVILPEELAAAERSAGAHGAAVAGFYHSHPDHPARPSVFDQEHAWPWYVYVILSSGPDAATTPPGAFELDPERREFRELRLTVEPATPSATSP